MTTQEKLLIVFARHGSYEEGRGCKDLGLNETGQMQSHLLGRALKDAGILGSNPLVLMSPQPRGRQSAAIVQSYTGGQLQAEEFLNLDTSFNTEDSLYLSEIEGFEAQRQFVAALPEKARTVIAVTHSPNIYRLSAIFGETSLVHCNPGRYGAAIAYQVDAKNWAAMDKTARDAARIVFEHHPAQQAIQVPRQFSRLSFISPQAHGPAPGDDEIPF